MERVANPGDILHLYKKAKRAGGKGGVEQSVAASASAAAAASAAASSANLAPVMPSGGGVGASAMEELLSEALKGAGAGLTTLSVDSINTALRRFVTESDAQAMRVSVEDTERRRRVGTLGDAAFKEASLLVTRTEGLKGVL